MLIFNRWFCCYALFKGSALQDSFNNLSKLFFKNY
jgi:hypothetical protein